MSNVLDQWLGDSISAIELLEREVNENHQVIQEAMATIRQHTAAVERLEQHIEVIRLATQNVESGIEEDRFDDSFDSTFQGYDGLDAAPQRVDEGAGTPVLQLHSSEEEMEADSGRTRLPPPPPVAMARGPR